MNHYFLMYTVMQTVWGVGRMPYALYLDIGNDGDFEGREVVKAIWSEIDER